MEPKPIQKSVTIPAVILLFSLLFTGCFAQKATSHPQARTLTATPRFTFTFPAHIATQKLHTTSSPIPAPGATQIPTERPVVLPIRSIIQKCATVEEAASPGFLSDGSILFVNSQNRNVYSLLVRNTTDNQTNVLPEIPQFLESMGSSPNQRYFAYRASDMHLAVLSGDGRLQAHVPWKRDWHSVQAWINDEQLLLHDDPVVTAGLSIDLFNPFSGELQELSPGFTDRFQYQVEDTGWFVWKLIYDPSLTRVTYTKDSATDGIVVAMVDIENDRTLWELKRGSVGPYYPPVWSPDGERMAVIASGDPEFDYQNFEVFFVERNGTALQWVDLKEVPEITADHYQWSPDGRYLAMDGTSIFILDTETRQLIDFCIPIANAVDPMIWSPDSRQVIFQREDDVAVVLDVEHGVVVPLNDELNIKPAAWLRSQP